MLFFGRASMIFLSNFKIFSVLCRHRHRLRWRRVEGHFYFLSTRSSRLSSATLSAIVVNLGINPLKCRVCLLKNKDFVFCFLLHNNLLSRKSPYYFLCWSPILPVTVRVTLFDSVRFGHLHSLDILASCHLLVMPSTKSISCLAFAADVTVIIVLSFVRISTKF